MLSKGGKRAIDFHAKIIGNEIYFYSSSKSVQHKFMHSLVGVFITKKSAVSVEEAQYYPLKIEISRQKARKLYLETQEKQEEWNDALKRASGYSNLFDYYNIDKELDEGQFGDVKLGSHKKTNEKVAIKVIKKVNMT
jgi:hypothetical protein